MNNLRILIIPSINMNGLLEQDDVDFSVFKGKNIQFDPMSDFNIKPEGPCFHGVTSQFLNEIYKEYLILGSLSFSKGDFEIEFPNLNSLYSIEKVTKDTKYLSTISNSLSIFMNIQNKDEIPQFTTVGGNFDSKKFIFPQKKHGTYFCLLYTSPSPRDGLLSRMPSSA